jgi:hypothetical protein
MSLMPEQLFPAGRLFQCDLLIMSIRRVMGPPWRKLPRRFFFPNRVPAKIVGAVLTFGARLW